jgi:purine-nucleoside/S-methyl-5'-thioadenosine phosphorylase / adenosine deaminase
VIVLELPGAQAVFSTREGGVSEGPYRSLNLGILTDDDPGRVAANRSRLASLSGFEPARVAMGWQVHGADVRQWDGPPEPAAFAAPGAALERVDGHTTTTSELALLVLVADCLPLALAASGRVAMLHCGWRGLAAGIVEQALEAFDEPPVAALGPAIGPCCYEVGPEVLAAFEGPDLVARGRMLDLGAIVRRKLEASGVARIEDVGLCTSCRPDLFFSHRRDGGVTGRQAGVVWLTA